MADVTDCRFSINDLDKPEHKVLFRKFGFSCLLNILVLRLYVARMHSDGHIKGETKEELEREARWSGEQGAFIDTLVEAKVLIPCATEGEYFYANWHNDQPWASQKEDRVNEARKIKSFDRLQKRANLDNLMEKINE